MAIQALYTAATGMKAMDFKLDVVANNLANIETVGFKRSRVNFADILYRTLERPGQRNALDSPLPTGKQVGLGVQVSGTQLSFEQGAAEPTKQPLDIMIVGNGMFQVQEVIDGTETTLFTRAGNFTTNADGELVLNNGRGSRLEPGIVIPERSTSIQISQSGLVQARPPGQPDLQDLGQIQIAWFRNPVGLLQLGDNLFQETDASGDPLEGNPGDEGLGFLRQNYLEQSNVDPVESLVNLIRTQRGFELNSQSLQSADQTLQIMVNLTRF